MTVEAGRTIHLVVAGAAAFRFQLGLLGLRADLNLGLPALPALGQSPASSQPALSASSRVSTWTSARADASHQILRAADGKDEQADDGEVARTDTVADQGDPGDGADDNPGAFGAWSSTSDDNGLGSFAISLGSLGAGLLQGTAGITFNLYTRRGSSPQPLTARDASSVRRSSFRADRPTKFLIHGYTANTKPGSGGSFLKDVLLRVADVNVILVDWSGVDPRIYPLDVRSTVPMVGAEVAKLVKTLIGLGSRAEDMHLIGHSLGAHVAGAAGSLSLGPMSAGRITGLDPAGPMFEGRAGASRLDKSDAGFVDAVHTDGGFLGIVQPVGHVDFYVDGGIHRHPSCGADLYGACTHCFAFEVYAHALQNPSALMGTKCDSHDHFRRGKCKGNDKTPIGLRTNSRSRGSFFLDSYLKPSSNLREVGASGLSVSTALNQLTRNLFGDGASADRFIRC